MTRPDLTAVAGVPETVLSAGLLARLPDSAPPPPWTCSGLALLWVGRAGSAARAALPPALRGPVLGVVGGFVRYGATPVGAYDEVFGVLASRTGTSPWGHVGFMAVDSPESLVGGRVGWGMPKTLAAFAHTATRFAAEGSQAEWRLAARPRAAGPGLPLRVAASARQVLPGGTVGASRLVARGRARVALVDVTVSSAEAALPLPAWLQPGRHLGLLVDDLRLTLSPPTPV